MVCGRRGEGRQGLQEGGEYATAAQVDTYLLLPVPTRYVLVPVSANDPGFIPRMTHTDSESCANVGTDGRPFPGWKCRVRDAIVLETSVV